MASSTPQPLEISQQSENPQTTTGYEPNINQGGVLPPLGVPPIDVIGGGPEAMLAWYLSQHAAPSGMPTQQGSAAASGVPQPPGLSQIPGGAPLALPFQGYWGNTTGMTSPVVETQ